MKVSEILKTKGPQVFTIGEEKSLGEALNIIVVNKIGVLIVLNYEGQISGILSERDIIRASYENQSNYLNLRLAEYMTKKVIIVEPEDDIDYVESVMTTNRFRHVPVISNKILVGLISIGDIVKTQLNEYRYENKYLKDYISGVH